MLSSIVESFLRGTGAGVLTELFIGLMLVVFLSALLFYKRGKWRAFTAYTSTLLTSLGILGTFAGVVTGLLDFDSSVEQIDQSIGLLLQGLKTAFTSSLVGMALSVIYKIIVLIPAMSPRGSNEVTDSITIDDLYELEKEQLNVLSTMKKAIVSDNDESVLGQLRFSRECQIEAREQRTENIIINKQISRLLSDDGESSLTGQMKLLRSDANDLNKRTIQQIINVLTSLQALKDQGDQLGQRQEEFSKASYDIGNRTLQQTEKAVTSLKELCEQGDHWGKRQEELSHASFQQIQTMRVDSANHGQQSLICLNSMLVHLEKSPTETLIAALEDVIRDFNVHISEQFGENFKQLNEAVGLLVEWQENYRTQIIDLQTSFETSVKTIGDCESSLSSIDKSAEAIPKNMQSLSEILSVSQHQLNDLDSHLKAFSEIKDKAVDSVPVLHNIIEDGVNGVRSATDKMSESINSSSVSLVSSITQSNSALVDSTSRINDQLTTVTKRMGDETTSILEGLRRSVEEQFRLSSENVEQLIDKEFKDMEDVRRVQVQAIMKEMGSALTSITGQFTRDYKSLTKAMSEIVRSGGTRGF